MADAKTVSPLLDDFSLGSPFSSHNGIICCPAIHAVTKEKFILKQVSVPESQTQVNAMLLTGACADQTAAHCPPNPPARIPVEEMHPAQAKCLNDDSPIAQIHQDIKDTGVHTRS